MEVFALFFYLTFPEDVLCLMSLPCLTPNSNPATVAAKIVNTPILETIKTALFFSSNTSLNNSLYQSFLLIAASVLSANSSRFVGQTISPSSVRISGFNPGISWLNWHIRRDNT